MAEGGQVQAQDVLFQARKLRESKCESAVVAEITKVAEMIGDPFALEGQRA